ncbi:MAG TPA: 3-hydroxyisobutyrate dehydrogenase [Methylomirabilota bacterium]|jgi:3-hydroxyisobutyrate dehydrogenase|nr:3-hydroxyisobutyrate dehydrogenase [Methylomirabilota bacterium]
MTTIGFVGIGNMGLPMLTNLVKAGHRVEAYDIRREALDLAVQRGATAGGSAAETAGRVEVLITMLPNSPEVEAAYLGPKGVLEGARPGLVCIDMSTIDPATTRRVGERLAGAGVRMLDAPVSGAVPRAVEGTLTIMVGGEATLAEAMRPILGAMGRNVIHVGPLGAGEVAKICNNLVAGVSMIAVAEAFTIGMRAGVDPRVLHEVISKSSGNCWAIEHNCPVPGLVPKAAANNAFAAGFMTDLMAKDLSLARAAARDLGATCFSGTLAHELYTLASRHGLGRKDFSSVIQLLTAANP